VAKVPKTGGNRAGSAGSRSGPVRKMAKNRSLTGPKKPGQTEESGLPTGFPVGFLGLQTGPGPVWGTLVVPHVFTAHLSALSIWAYCIAKWNYWVWLKYGLVVPCPHVCSKSSFVMNLFPMLWNHSDTVLKFCLGTSYAAGWKVLYVFLYYKSVTM
jgi:hypothetical protein